MNTDTLLFENEWITCRMMGNNLFIVEYGDKVAEDSEFYNYLEFLQDFYKNQNERFYQITDQRKVSPNVKPKHRFDLAD